MHKLVSGITNTLTTCQKKGVRYWCFAIIFTALGWWGSHALEAIDAWLDLKNRAYLAIQDLRGGQKKAPFTTLVAIDDEDYYGQELAARKPLKRSYVAKLISRIAEARPLVIALDIDFRSPAPGLERDDFADYDAEDHALFAAVCAAKQTTKIVLSKAVIEAPNGGVVADPNIYDHAPECQIPADDIAVGFLSLPFDLRRVPLSVRIDDTTIVDSFALAIARSVRPQQYPRALDITNLPYGEFHEAGDFVRVPASDVLNGGAKDKLHGRVVMVFGAWHVLARGRGVSVVDTFRTPIGFAPGAYVHANLVETLISANLRAAPPEWTTEVCDILVALWLAVSFAFHNSLLKKLGKILWTAVALLIGAWLFFQIFAVFFDILPVLAAMTMHAIVDQVAEWREAAGRALPAVSGS